jgi:hypothetical protein
MCPLEVDALTSGIGSNQNLNGWVLPKGFLGLGSLYAPEAAMDRNDRLGLG